MTAHATDTASPISIERLREAVRGRVIGPDDADYDALRKVTSGAIDRHPAVIVRVADVADVQAVVNLARESGQELAVRSRLPGSRRRGSALPARSGRHWSPGPPAARQADRRCVEGSAGSLDPSRATVGQLPGCAAWRGSYGSIGGGTPEGCPM